MEPCNRCGAVDRHRMIALMSRWFAAHAGLPLEAGYFYLCPACYREKVEGEFEAIAERIRAYQKPDRASREAAAEADAAAQAAAAGNAAGPTAPSPTPSVNVGAETAPAPPQPLAQADVTLPPDHVAPATGDVTADDIATPPPPARPRRPRRPKSA